MEKRVLFDTWQKVTLDDFLKLGTFPQQSFDTIVGKLLIPDMAYEGFQVIQTGPAEVTVGNGHLFNGGRVYFNNTEGGTIVDLLARLPAATKKIVAITVYGSDIDDKLEPRTFLTDANTRATVARESSTEHWRWANVAPVSGSEGPDPVDPAVAANVCVVAWVTLDTTGVASIVMNTENLAPTLRGEDNRLNALDIWKAGVGTQLDTMKSDLLALMARIFGLAKFEFVRGIAADVARLKDYNRLPQTYTAWSADHYLTNEQSETTHVDYHALTFEGVRFPAFAVSDSQLGLLNIYEASVTTTANIMLPAWDSALRIVNPGADVELSIATYQFQTVNMIQKTMTKERTRYGTPFTVCSNHFYWNAEQGWIPGFNGTIDYLNWTFVRDTGEVYNIVSTVDQFTTESFSTLGAHSFIRLQNVWKDTVEEPYWDKVTTTTTIGGAIIAQSFVNSQDGWMDSIGISFSRAAASGDVWAVLTETTNGGPDLTKVLARSSVPPADIKPSGQYTWFHFTPTFLTKGRYAVVLVTAGNHFVWCTQDKNNMSGTLFISTDGAWFQGDVTRDISMAVSFCKFRQNQTQVQLQPLALGGGIAAVDILAQSYTPPGCRLYYEIQVAGVWHALDNVDGGPSVQFVGLPPLLPFRAVFVGTEAVQPALGVASNSRVQCSRPSPAFTHISKPRTTPSVTTITADIRLEAWRSSALLIDTVGQPHRFRAKLLHGALFGTIRNADAVTIERALDDPNAVIAHYTWTGMGALTTFRFRLEGETTNVLTTFHVAERIDIDT